MGSPQLIILAVCVSLSLGQLNDLLALSALDIDIPDHALLNLHRGRGHGILNSIFPGRGNPLLGLHGARQNFQNPVGGFGNHRTGNIQSQQLSIGNQLNIPQHQQIATSNTGSLGISNINNQISTNGLGNIGSNSIQQQDFNSLGNIGQNTISFQNTLSNTGSRFGQQQDFGISNSIIQRNQQVSQGNIGLQRTQGINGLQGTQRTQGNAGLQGIIGLQGAQGLQRNQGLQGIPELQRTQDFGISNSIIQRNPQVSQGNIGLQRTQGLQGINGLQGTQRTQGNTGLQGTIGLQGAQGVQRIQGLQGIQDLQGIQGLQRGNQINNAGRVRAFRRGNSNANIRTAGGLRQRGLRQG